MTMRTEVSIAHLPQPGKHFVGREDELALLDKAWLDPKTNIVEFVAFGGVGKSALVAEWLQRMQADEYRGAARVFGHSFYSQGSREDAQASADSFLDSTLRFFGETEDEAKEGSPWDKGERLARLVRQQPTLLILDGVEPLQSPGQFVDAGELRDPGLKALLVELAAQMNGMVLISTRARVTDIEGRHDFVISHDLSRLSPEAGIALLRDIEVQGEDEELKKAVDEVAGHALSVSLVGNYVTHAGSGHIADREEIGLHEMGTVLAPDAGEKENRKYTAQTFSRIMQRYEVWLHGLSDSEGNVDTSGRLALEIARLTGLFDRPITAGEFAALVGRFDEEAHTKTRSYKDEDLRGFVPSCENPPIPGLTDLAGEASEGEVNLATGRLVEYGLITKVTDSRIRLSVPSWPSEAASEVVLDAHPLVREYFAKALKESSVGATGSASADSTTANTDEESTGRASGTQLAEAVRAAHRRLYEHLKQSAPERPNNLNDMMPLYHAVAHGCKAGLWQEVLYDVWWDRIHRQQYFSTSRLGAIGTDLGAISSFFVRTWTTPEVTLRPNDKAMLLANAAQRLRSLGRSQSTREAFGASLETYLTEKNWEHASITASNLSELSLTLGDVSSAVRQGEQSVELADRSGDAFERMGNRTTLAAALFCAGQGEGVTR